MIHFPDRIKMGERIKMVSELKENWNDNGALPFSQNIIKKCRELLSVLPYPMEIFPVANGSVQFEKDMSNNRFVKLNVYEDRISLFYVDAFSDTHLMPNVPQDYLIEFLKGICKDDKDT